MADKIPVRVVLDASNVATGLAEFQSGDTLALSHGGTGTALSIGLAGQVLRVNADRDALEFVDSGDIDIIASSDSTGVQVQDDLNVSGTLSVNVLDVNEISSVDSTAITIKDDLMLAGTLRAEDSGTISIDGAADISGAIQSGGVVTATGFTIGSAVIDETDLEKIDGITNGAGAANKALVLDSSANIASGLAAVTASGVVTAAGFTIGSAVINETDLEKIDGITNGAGAANKALVLDGSANIASGLAAVTASGVITAAGFTIGSAAIVEAELEMIDGITAGTAAASKALVLDSDKDIGTIRNITSNGTVQFGSLSDGTITVTAFVDEDDMSSDSATLVPTQQSVKAYVDAQSTPPLQLVGDDSTTMEINLENDRLFFQGGTNISTSTDSGAQLTISVADAPTFSGTVTAGGFTIGSAAINEAELETIDGITAGTVAASKAVIVDANKDVTGFRNVTGTGDVEGASLTVSSGVAITASSGDVTVANATSNKDLIFTVNDGGSATEVFRLDGDVSAMLVASGKELRFADSGEKISGDGTDLTIASGAKINLTATSDVVVPANVGITFGTGEKIEGDNTDLTITSGADITLAATADVNIPVNVGLRLGDGGENIETDNTDLTITSGGKINLAATSDVHLANNIGLVFGDAAEKIEGDGTDLTITGNNIKLTAAADIVVPANVGITFGTGEKIEGDSTDLTVTSGAKINLNATSDIHIPNDVGIVFGGASEKIEGDGTDLVISANNLTVDAAADIILDAGGNDFQFKAGGTHVLSVVNSSSDVIIKPIVDEKDIIFQQRDGTEVARIEDNATFNVVTGKLAINGTAITSTAAELNLVDGITAGTVSASKAVITDSNKDALGFRNISATGTAEIGGDLQVGGNFTVSGTTTSVNTTNIEIQDALLELNKNNSGGADVDAGIFIQRGSAGNNAVLYWNEGDDTFKAVLSNSVATADAITDSSFAGLEVGSLTVNAGVAITASSGDVTVANATSNKDLIFTVNDGGSATEVMRLDGDVSAILVASGKELRFADSGEKISGDGTDLTIASGAKINLTATSDVVVPANVGITFGTGEKIEGDNTNITVTSGGAINLTATTDVVVPANVGITFGTGEKIEGDNTDLTVTSGGKINLTATTDVVVPANVGITFGDGEKIEGDDTNITVTSGGAINLTATTDVVVPANVGITFGTGEKIEGDNTDLTVTSGAKIVLAATSDVEIPANIGITFGTGEKIEGDNTDLTITSGADITLAATADVNIPVNVGLRLGDGGENIETDNTDLTITSGGKINLATASDVHLANDKGIVFGDAGEKIEGDGTDLTISSSAKLNLTASSDVHIPKNIGLVFDDNASEKIESDDTDLTIASGAKINLNATSDVHIPNNVGIVFGGASEKIEGDGTDLVISANNLTVDAAADIILDAGGNDFQFKAGGTHILSVVNSSSDVIIKPIVDAKDIIFQQRDGTEVARIEDNATFNVVTGKLAINGTAITSTAAELNALDGITAVVGELNALDLGDTAVGNAIASKAVILDSNKDYTGLRNVTLSGELDAGSLDVSGNADIDGTLEADAITVNGTALADVIAGTTVNLATLASTVTITDNESTNENNALIFTAGGDVDGGNLGLESDGTCTYNPSTGKITATGFVGTLTGTASAAQYSDLAERYHADAVMEKGDIVEIGGTNEITKTTQEISPDVFGVISHEDQAAFKMNDGHPDNTHPLVALTGRADVKVIGPISKGDRLVTSSISGIARKALMSECTAFTVIGRALQDKTTEDVGIVLCYVNAKS